ELRRHVGYRPAPGIVPPKRALVDLDPDDGVGDWRRLADVPVHEGVRARPRARPREEGKLDVAVVQEVVAHRAVAVDANPVDGAGDRVEMVGALPGARREIHREVEPALFRLPRCLRLLHRLLGVALAVLAGETLGHIAVRFPDRPQLEGVADLVARGRDRLRL